MGWCLTLLELIDHNDDLKQLLNEGYEVEFFNIYLMIHHVPYVNNRKQVAYGTLVSKSKQSGHTLKPKDHTALWVGDYPCDSEGSRLVKLGDSTVSEKIREGSVATFLFSQKPSGGYQNHHHKMTQYVKILGNEARVIDPKARAITFRPVKLSEEESVFCYADTASSRVGITSINDKIRQDRIAIVGLGGTGSYILDLVAKTPVGEIHLFDGDEFYNHNAFRSPGAASYAELSKNTAKVKRFAEIYSHMRRKIIPHPQLIDKSNIAELSSMNTVFVCVDNGESRKMIADYLIKNKVPFIDTGLSILKNDEKLTGLVRVTTCTPSFHDHVVDRIPFGSNGGDEYSSNIQIAEMNALNASLAVIKWKKMCGFYLDISNAHNTIYGISTNTVANDETADEA